MSEYQPFGDEWAREVMVMRKHEIVAVLKEQCQRIAELEGEKQRLRADATRYRDIALHAISAMQTVAEMIAPEAP